jgi:hypothetical protein
MIPILDDCRKSHSRTIVMANKSCFFFSHYHTGKWTTDTDNYNKVPQRVFKRKKMIAIVIWSLARFHVIDFLPEGAATNIQYFIECVLRPFARVLYPGGVRPGKRKVWLRFDDSQARRLRSEMAEAGLFEFKRLSHPPYSHDMQDGHQCPGSRLDGIWRPLCIV